MERRIRGLRSLYDRKLGEKETLENQIEILQREARALQIETLEQCLVVLQKLSEYHREQARRRLEDLGTLALQYSMGPDYKMILSIRESRRKPVADLFIENTSTGLVTSPVDENGGGIVDMLSIAMRIIALQCLEDPPVDGPIILDEPFKMVSERYIPMLTNFVKQISGEFGRQIILVTHNDYLASTCDQVLRVSIDERGQSKVEEEVPVERD